MPEPLDIHFNVAVLAMADALFPCGFDVTMNEDEAPSDLASLNAHIAKTGRMLVWGGASDATIFGSPEINWAFRAWHDWCHWKIQADMTDAGEYAAYIMMCKTLADKYGREHSMLPYWFSILYVEVVEMNRYHARFGRFPYDQRAFTERMLHELRHVSLEPLAA